MSQTSILVPLGTDLQAFDSTLASILRFRPRNCEILVVHDGTYEDPYDLVEEVNLVSCPGSNSLIEFFNRAMHQVGGEFVHLVRPGVEVGEGWLDGAIPEFDDHHVGSVTPLLLEESGDAVLSAGVSCSRSMRRRIFGEGANERKVRRHSQRILGPSSNAAFYRTKVLQEIGPVDASLGDDYLDVEIALSMKNLGYETRLAVDSRLRGNPDYLDVDHNLFSAGRDAQRMIRRHIPLDESQTQSYCRQVLALELAASLIRPANLVEIAGRLSATRNSDEDREVRRRLESAPQQHRAA